MKWWSVLCWAAFSVFLFSDLQAQSVEQLKEYAQHQFRQGRFELAAREFQRALFFGPRSEVGKLNMLTGDCYFQMGKYKEAEGYYRFAGSVLPPDSLRLECLLRKSACHILTGNNRMAIFELLSLSTGQFERLEEKRNILLGVSYFGLSDFVSSERYFLDAMHGADNNTRDSVRLLFQSKKLFRPKPVTAYWLSVIMPGAGQFYAGDIKNGLNSFLLNGTLITTGFWLATRMSPLDAFFTIFPWYQRYFVGGYQSAKKIAASKLATHRAEVYRRIYGIVAAQMNVDTVVAP